MSPQTIPVKFDPKTLPAWARRIPAVVKLAESNLVFRCNIHEAKSSEYQRFLVRQAESLSK